MDPCSLLTPDQLAAAKTEGTLEDAQRVVAEEPHLFACRVQQESDQAFLVHGKD